MCRIDGVGGLAFANSYLSSLITVLVSHWHQLEFQFRISIPEQITNISTDLSTSALKVPGMLCDTEVSWYIIAAVLTMEFIFTLKCCKMLKT